MYKSLYLEKIKQRKKARQSGAAVIEDGVKAMSAQAAAHGLNGLLGSGAFFE